ncbi:DUF7144 family membrane protein [Actinomadura scrupuli]|uniref:DUF7144 family membrane protein n=1 Tax=Actinomadura scrupuli TaxID=559629 RepID=UPI003D983A22
MTDAAGHRASASPITSPWLTFGGLLLGVAGFLNVIDGLVAFSKKDYFLVTQDKLLFFNYTTWGWIWLIVGIVQLVVGGAIMARQPWARPAGITIAVLAILGQLIFLKAYPPWSIIAIAICWVAIYVLMIPPPRSIAL